MSIKCSKCKNILQPEEFYVDKSRYNGYSSYCKLCNQIKNKIWRENNLEHHRQVSSDYYYNNYEERKEQSRLYHWKNREQRLKYLKEWGKLNKKESDRRYLSTEKGKLVHSLSSKRTRDKRKRNMKFILLMDNPLPEDIKVDYHHINNLLVIPIPRKLHIGNNGIDKNLHREKCNIIIKNIYGLDVDILNGKI